MPYNKSMLLTAKEPPCFAADDANVRSHSQVQSMSKIIISLAMVVSTFGMVHATSLESWVGGDEFSHYRLIESKNIEDNYFAVFQSGSEVIVASRKLVEIGSTGGHRIKVELRGNDGTDLVANETCPKREVKSATALCGNKYCQSNTEAYLVNSDHREILNYMVRWRWITADAPDAKHMRDYIQEYLEKNELPVILEGQVVWK